MHGRLSLFPLSPRLASLSPPRRGSVHHTCLHVHPVRSSSSYACCGSALTHVAWQLEPEAPQLADSISYRGVKGQSLPEPTCMAREIKLFTTFLYHFTIPLSEKFKMVVNTTKIPVKTEHVLPFLFCRVQKLNIFNKLPRLPVVQYTNPYTCT